MLSKPYVEVKRLRSIGNCAAALSLLASHRPASDDEGLEAAVCLLVCAQAENAVHVCRTHGWKAPWARKIAQALSGALTGDGDGQALSLAREAMADPAASPTAAGIYVLLLQRSGLVDEAAAYISGQLPDPPAGETFLLTLAAETAVASKSWTQASRFAAGVLAADPDDCRALVAASIAHFHLGNIHHALGHALRVDALQPGAPPAILQIMRCRNKIGDHYAALGAFETLEDKSNAASEFHLELARAYSALEHHAKAIDAYRAALAADPASAAAARELATVYAITKDAAGMASLAGQHAAVVQNDVDSMAFRGLEAFNRGDVPAAGRLLRDAHAVSEAGGRPYGQLPWPVPEPRVRHDYEQLELLQRRSRLDRAGRDALQALAPYYAQSGDPEMRFAPDGAAGEALKRALAGCHYLPQSTFSGDPLGSNDYPGIETGYFARRLVVIDDFLSPEALAALREYSEEATIWKRYYRHGYVGAMLAQGFSPEVLLAIAGALRQAMPRVIADHPLLQAWAFKYDQRMQGINMHADFARVNVNFWITPDEACADPETGGMVVYDTPVPPGWTFADYNTDPRKLAAYVRLNEANAVRVPYRANRCVLFDSSLIHVTDVMRFKPGYENRRVNVTLLYGYGGR